MAGGGDQAGVGEDIGGDALAWARQRLQRQIDPMLPTLGDDQRLGLGGHAEAGHPVGQMLAVGRYAAVRLVLHRALENLGLLGYFTQYASQGGDTHRMRGWQAQAEVDDTILDGTAGQEVLA